MSLSSNAHVLIVRLSAIGDCLLTLPMANALKDRYPGCRLTWVVERPASPLLAAHPSIDDLIVLARGWYKSPSEIWRLRKLLRSRPIDIAFDPQSLTKSSFIAYLSGARRRVGLARPYGRELALMLNNIQIEPTHEHVVDRQLEMLHTIGIRWPEARFDLPEDEPARRSVARWLDESACRDQFACINTGATWNSKLWPTDRYAEVAARLGRRRGLPTLIVWGTPTERQWAEEIAERSEGFATVAPPTTLLELGAVLRRAAFYLGSDTGPMHLAAAVGTPCIGLFGATRPENSGPYGPRHTTLQSYYQAGTSRQRRSANNDAMCCITPDMVEQACEQILASATDRQAA